MKPTNLSRMSALLVPLLLLGCAGDPSSGAIQVRGRIVDAETGEVLSRQSIYVHAFNDAIGHQVSLRPEDATDFELEMPQAEIRLRVPEQTNAYELFEETFVAENGVLDVTIPMQPTHWVRLHGTVLFQDADGILKPVKQGDGNVRKARLSAGPKVSFRTDENGNYSILVPRERRKILSINTNYAHSPTEFDLTDVTADEHEFHIVLTPRR